MKIFRSSIRQLTLMGSLIIALPLIIALVSTMIQVDKLAVTLERVLETIHEAVDVSRVVANNALSMERSASQYLVLKDYTLLEKYSGLRNQMMDAVEELRGNFSSDHTILVQLDALLKKEAQTYDMLKSSSLTDESSVEIVEPIGLSELARPLPGVVSEFVKSESNRVKSRITSIKKRLYWQIFGLLPLFLIMAVIFTIWVTSPLKRLGKKINLLGEGNLTENIEPYGPTDIRQLSEQLDWLRKQLAEIDEQKSTFLQHVSHELKTPLTSIREGIDLLQDGVVGELNQSQVEIVQILTQNSHQLQEEVEALLNFNNALAAKPIDPEILDLSELIYQIVKEQLLAAKARNITIKLSLEKLNTSGDWQQLRVLIGNLLTNAIKYSPDNETIRVKLWSQDDQLVIDVIDRGAGISKHDRKEIFEPFYQGSRLPKGHIKGTGLGLAIAQKYAILHHGSLELLETEVGAHFKLVLPHHSVEEDI